MPEPTQRDRLARIEIEYHGSETCIVRIDPGGSRESLMIPVELEMELRRLLHAD